MLQSSMNLIYIRRNVTSGAYKKRPGMKPEPLWCFLIDRLYYVVSVVDSDADVSADVSVVVVSVVFAAPSTLFSIL